MANNPFMPTVQPIPENAAVYSPEKLFLLGKVDREAYEKILGVQAPACLQYRKLKLWKDDSLLGKPPTAVVTYKVLDYHAAKLMDMSITVEEATLVNLPGVRHYPKWEVAPTAAKIVGPNNLSTPITPTTLSTKEQAAAVAAEVGGKVRQLDVLSSDFRYYYPPEEKRRCFVLDFPDGNVVPVGYLLLKKYINGVDAPGRWRGLDWVPEEEFDGAGLEEVPFPCRDLHSNERLVRNPFGLQIHVKERLDPTPTDLQDSIKALAVKVDEVRAGVDALRKLFGI